MVTQRIRFTLPDLLRALIITVFIGPGCAQSSPTLRIMTWNIHHGEGTDGVFDLERIARVIVDEAPDVVAIQEVDVRTNRASGFDQAAELGRLTNMYAVFGPAMPYDGGQYGDLLLTRTEPEDYVAHPLPHSPNREPRVAVAVSLRTTDGEAYTVICTHLDHLRDDGDRIAQIDEINGRFRPVAPDEDRPVILAGDLNDVPDSEPINRLERAGWTHTGFAPTFPSDAPDRMIDYVLVRPSSRFRVIEHRVLDEAIASDHRALVVDLEIQPRPVDEE